MRIKVMAISVYGPSMFVDVYHLSLTLTISVISGDKLNEGFRNRKYQENSLADFSL